MITQIKVEGQINNKTDAIEIFDEVISSVEKQYESIYGNFSVSFENQIGIHRKLQTGTDTSLNTKI